MSKEIIKEFGQWVVYKNYILCESTDYSLDIDTLIRHKKEYWSNHMRDKRWLNMQEFEDAMNYLLALHGL